MRDETLEPLVKKVKKEMDKRYWNEKVLAIESDIKKSSVIKFLNCDNNITLHELFQIAHAVGYRITIKLVPIKGKDN